jgi:GTP cyclohydrolase I/GTP cyclohydrolase-4
MNRPSGLISPSMPDVQAGRPRTELSLTRVGVTGVEKVIRVDAGAGGGGQLFFAQMQCFVDLNPQQAGVHMSRFEEIVNEAIDEVVLSQSLKAEALAGQIAELVRDRQGGLRAEVDLTARYPETVPTPATGNTTQEIYTLFGTAVASERGTRTVTGVQAQGMTACPCAQQLVASGARERLAEAGYRAEQIDEVLELVPVATHNQRGIGTLHLGSVEGVEFDVDARELLRIVESSMSSEIYELMKRADERAVVEKAHANPRFVEDCVREMVRQVAERFPELGAGGFVLARQENLETIHRHNVVAERAGELSEILAELGAGTHTRHHMTMREWLEAPAA